MKGHRKIFHSDIGVSAVCGEHGEQCNNQSYALKRCYVPPELINKLLADLHAQMLADLRAQMLADPHASSPTTGDSTFASLRALLLASKLIRETVYAAGTMSIADRIFPRKRGVYIPVPLGWDDEDDGDGTDLFFPDRTPSEVDAAITHHAYDVNCQVPIRVRVVCLKGPEEASPDLRSTFLLPSAILRETDDGTSMELVTGTSCVHDSHATPARAARMHHVANDEVWRKTAINKQMQLCGILSHMQTMPLADAIAKLHTLGVAFDEAVFSAAFEHEGEVPCFSDPLVAAMAQVFALKTETPSDSTPMSDLDKVLAAPSDLIAMRRAAVLIAFGVLLQCEMQKLALPGLTPAPIAHRMAEFLARWLVTGVNCIADADALVEAACSIVPHAKLKVQTTTPPRAGSVVVPESNRTEKLVHDEPTGAMPPLPPPSVLPEVVTGSVKKVVVDAVATELEKHKQALKSGAIDAASKFASNLVTKYAGSGKTADTLHGIVASVAHDAK